MSELKYKRVLLKLSGEVLAGKQKTGVDVETVGKICDKVKEIVEMGVQVAIVVGGGNFWRGRNGHQMERTTADYMGMLATAMNGLALQDALEVSKSVTNNYVMLSIIETSINNMLTGNSWIEPFEKSGLCSPMTVEMLKIGMQTDLTEMLGKLLEFMDMDINVTIERVMKVMPEIAYSIVGVVLIFFTCVVLVPVIQVYMGSFLFSAYT